MVTLSLAHVPRVKSEKLNFQRFRTEYVHARVYSMDAGKSHAILLMPETAHNGAPLSTSRWKIVMLLATCASKVADKRLWFFVFIFFSICVAVLLWCVFVFDGELAEENSVRGFCGASVGGCTI